MIVVLFWRMRFKGACTEKHFNYLNACMEEDVLLQIRSTGGVNSSFSGHQSFPWETLPEGESSPLKPDGPSSLGLGPPRIPAWGANADNRNLLELSGPVRSTDRQAIITIACSSLRAEYLHPGSPWQLEQKLSPSLQKPSCRG